MKKILLAIVVAVAGLFGLASCEQTKVPTEPTQQATPQKKVFTVEFNTDGGSEVAAVEVNEGEKLTLPTNPTKEGFVFNAWYTDVDCTQKFDATATITEDMTLYAQWATTLTFDSNGGTAVEPITKPYTGKLVLYELPAAPVREGYAFVGWYTDKEFTTELSALAFPKKNTTAYAKWLALDTTIKYEFANFASNDANAFTVEGTKFTATEALGEWTMVISEFGANLNGYDTVVMDVIGTEGTEILLKFEGDGVAASYTEGETTYSQINEQAFVLTGKEQKIIWNFPKQVLAESGKATCKFGFFLAPGKAGTAEGVKGAYVDVKSAYACRVAADGEQDKQYAVTYVTNGDKPVTAQFVNKGEKAVKPADPEKDGYVFEGWFKDAACTQAYDWNTVLEESITLYAKWEESAVKFVVLDALQDTYTSGDEGLYTSVYENGKLTISRTQVPDDKQWSCVNGSILGKEIIGMKYLYLTLKGTKDQQVLVKINNQFETWVTFTGETQNVVIDMSKVKVNADVPALYFFVNGGKSMAGSVEISNIVFSSYRFKVSALQDTYTSGDEGLYTAVYADGKLTLSRTQVPDDKQWANVAGTLKGSDIAGSKYLYVTVKGTKDQQLLVKFNNQHETWITFTGETQRVLIDISRVKVNLNDPAVLFFLNGGKSIAGTAEITEVLFTSYTDSVSALQTEFKSGDEGLYTAVYADGKLTLSRTQVPDDKQWSCVNSALKGADIVGSKYLYVTVKGTKDQQLLVKFNNQHETWITFTGETQTVRIDISKVKVNLDAPALVLFLNGGKSIAGTAEITELRFTSTIDPVNLLEKDLIASEETHVTITKGENYVEVAKDVQADSWANVKTTLKGSDVNGASVLMVVLQGTKDSKVLVKFNNQHETWVTLTGEMQTVAINISKVKVNNDEHALYLFVNGGEAKAASVKLYGVAVGDVLGDAE